ncbi:PqqD family peptide modification chaperone [Actinokineospora inagensis]|uniref:PqqD family peptide modification chaperone n=1 Tax=Actinokineospora inagensis TaxID=103730 RepID=UPI003CCBF707
MLFPEGVLVLNSTAEAVLRSCDGAATVPEIVSVLERRYAGVRAEDVLTVLRGFAARGVIQPEEQA